MMAELLLKAQQGHDQEATIQILECFTPKVKGVTSTSTNRSKRRPKTRTLCKNDRGHTKF
ncbi:hypothetical protein HMSSN036_95710 [Paenibacillus macerans]|nr:hypothetical protein HMSSN036_95710 [Paenibacillus macerans]